jgi:hypothetical protein
MVNGNPQGVPSTGVHPLLFDSSCDLPRLPTISIHAHIQITYAVGPRNLLNSLLLHIISFSQFSSPSALLGRTSSPVGYTIGACQ